MTLQEVIDKLIKLNNSNDEKAIMFQQHILKVIISYEDYHVLTIKDKK